MNSESSKFNFTPCYMANHPTRNFIAFGFSDFRFYNIQVIVGMGDLIPPTVGLPARL
jgi:hypothetical protein